MLRRNISEHRRLKLIANRCESDPAGGLVLVVVVYPRSQTQTRAVLLRHGGRVNEVCDPPWLQSEDPRV